MSTDHHVPGDLPDDDNDGLDARLGAAGENWRSTQPGPRPVDPRLFRASAPRRTGWLVAASAAAVVLIVGGVFVAAGGLGGTRAVGPASSGGPAPTAAPTGPPTDRVEPPESTSAEAPPVACRLELVPAAGSDAEPVVVDCVQGDRPGAEPIAVACDVVTPSAVTRQPTEVRPPDTAATEPLTTGGPTGSQGVAAGGVGQPGEVPGSGTTEETCTIVMKPGDSAGCISVIRVAVPEGATAATLVVPPTGSNESGTSDAGDLVDCPPVTGSVVLVPPGTGAAAVVPSPEEPPSTASVTLSPAATAPPTT